MSDYNEEAYENALIEIWDGSMFMARMLNATDIFRFMILYLKILSADLILARHLMQLTRHFLNSDTLKMPESLAIKTLTLLQINGHL